MDPLALVSRLVRAALRSKKAVLAVRQKCQEVRKTANLTEDSQDVAHITLQQVSNRFSELQ